MSFVTRTSIWPTLLALVIENVSLDVREGEFAVVSPGCGKSTLMKLISGLRMPSGGYVRYVDGRQVGGC